MADQATVSRDSGANKGNGVVAGIAGLGNDMVNLAELQLRLAALDFKDSSEKAALPLALTLIGAAGVVGALPVALLGVASLLAGVLKWDEGWALLLTGGVVIVAAGLLMAIAAVRFRSSFSSFQRSREELVRNTSWIRTILLLSGRPVKK
jgi:uncharacterized membrane protein YqjE